MTIVGTVEEAVVIVIAVADITQSVAVVIGLQGVRRQGTVVADVTHTVAVAVILGGALSWRACRSFRLWDHVNSAEVHW